MDALEDKNKRKALITTSVVHGVLLVLFFFFGLSYLEPKPEEGISISLGMMVEGAASDNPAVNQAQEEVQEQEKVEAQQETPQEAVEEMATQDHVEAPVIEQETETTPTEEEVVEEEKEPQPDEQAVNALDKLLNNQSNSNGNTEGSGIDGRPEGEDFTPNFNNPDGLGKLGEGYYLNGRNALSTPKPKYPCDAQGKVIVKVWVSKQGEVRRCEAGVKGSTTTDLCLMREAEKAAKETRWQSDMSAADSQIGYIVYIFKKN